jgi:hypothetical protein
MEPKQTIQIPQRYKQIGVRTGFSPTPAELLRMIIEARPGRGKTQFLMSIPDQLVFDFDRACEDAVGQRSTFVPISTWDEYSEVKALLLADTDPATRPFKRIAFDTADRFLTLLDTHLTETINFTRTKYGKPPLNSITEYGDGGSGYAKLTAAFLSELRDFEAAGYPYTLACHMRVRTEKVGDITLQERRCVMPPSTMEALVGMVDLKARMDRTIENSTDLVKEKKNISDGKGGVRTLEIETKRTAPETKYWMMCMPSTPSEERDDDTKRRVPTFEGGIEIPLIDGFEAFKTRYNQAVAKAATL